MNLPERLGQVWEFSDGEVVVTLIIIALESDHNVATARWQAFYIERQTTDAYLFELTLHAVEHGERNVERWRRLA